MCKVCWYVRLYYTGYSGKSDLSCEKHQLLKRRPQTQQSHVHSARFCRPSLSDGWAQPRRCRCHLCTDFWKCKMPPDFPAFVYSLQCDMSAKRLQRAGGQYNTSMICEICVLRKIVQQGIIILIYRLYVCRRSDQRWWKDKGYWLNQGWRKTLPIHSVIQLSVL